MKRPRVLEQVNGFEGWAATRTRGNHWRITGPGGVLLFASSSPSDWRTWRNTLADLRRAGAPEELISLLRGA